MHILHIAASCGPQSASGRLCIALKNTGCHISTLVLEPPSLPDAYISPPLGSILLQKKLISRLGKIPFLFYPHRNRNIIWSSHLFGGNLSHIINKIKPDIVHLHWIAASTISLACLKKISCPIVWTFHDVWPLTAGCHCQFECTQWKNKCTDCIQLKKCILPLDICSWLWKNKANKLKELNITAITPSRWLTSIAKESPLWKNKAIVHIPNAIDTKKFSPGEKTTARLNLNIPLNDKVILFGATESDLYHKGFDLLIQALSRIKNTLNLHLLIFGHHFQYIDLPIQTTFTGWISNIDQLVTVYRSADVYVAPSRQESLNMTLVEASSCGIPCVSFNTTGMPDTIKHCRTGYLARPFDIDDLAKGIKQCFDPNNVEWGKNARVHAITHFDASIVSKQHIELYKSLL